MDGGLRSRRRCRHGAGDPTDAGAIRSRIHAPAGAGIAAWHGCADDGAAALQELLAHHQWSRSGFFTACRRGRPTHNTTGSNAGATPEDDADASFDDRKNRPLFTRGHPTRPRSRMANGWRSFSGLIPSLSQVFMAAAVWTRCRLAPCKLRCGRPRLATGWTRCLRRIPGTASIFSDEVIAADSRVLHVVCLRTRPASCHPHRGPAVRHSSDDGVLAHSVVSGRDPSCGRVSAHFLGFALQPAAQDRCRLDGDEPERLPGSAKPAIRIRRCSTSWRSILRRLNISRATRRAWFCFST